MSFIDRLAPGFRDGRREIELKRPRHFRLLRGLSAPPPPPLEDLPAPDVDRINADSRRYFERGGHENLWANKPFSDPPWTGWTLTRFGQLLTALDLRPGDRVLDFGCGTGWTSEMLARMGMDVVGMDVAPEALAIARRTASKRSSEAAGTEPRFELYAGGALEWPDGHFDAVVIFDAFHHLPNPRQALSEFHRVLAPNCRLGMAEPGVGHSEEVHSKAEMETGVLEREIDLEQLYEGARAAGFMGLEAVVPGLHPHAVTLPMRRLRWYLRGLSWLVPANHVRLAILGAPIVLLWKGPYFISSLHPRNQAAVVRPAVGTMACRPGAPFTLDVEVENENATVWLREGRHGRGFVRLGAQLLDGSGAMLEHDFARAELPHDVAIRQRARLVIAARAPAEAGRYTLRLAMVNEGIAWMTEGRSQSADVVLNVAG